MCHCNKQATFFNLIFIKDFNIIKHIGMQNVNNTNNVLGERKRGEP